MSRSLTLAVGVCLAGSLLCSRPAEADLFGQLEANGSALEGDSADPNHPDWSDLASLSLVFGVDTIDQTLTIRFSMISDSTQPLLLQAFQNNQNIDGVFEATSGSNVIERYTLSGGGNRITNIAISHDSTGTGRLTGFIGVDELEVEHVPSGNITFWDFSAIAGSSQFLPGDFGGDGVVDSEDYEKWRRQFGAVMGNLGGGADGNADGVVDAIDYAIWRENFFDFGGAATSSTPEPSSIMLLAALLLLIPGRRSFA